MVFPNRDDISYEVCPRCGGYGQVQDPQTGTYVICDYCKGKGVVAFIDEEEPSEFINDSISMKKVKIDLIKLFVIFGLTSIIGYEIYSLYTCEDLSFYFLSALWQGFIFGGGFGVFYAIMLILFMNYLPIISGLAYSEDNHIIIEKVKEYKKQTKTMFIIYEIELIALSLTYFIMFLFIAPMTFFLLIVIYGVKLYSNENANKILRIMSLLALVLLVFATYWIFLVTKILPISL
ncbi:MAG: hypothetical protein ACTSU2_10275 [Promethearchaeota archaeon]